MTVYELACCSIGLTIGNFAYAFGREYGYSKAIEHSYFQFVALLAYFIVDGTESMINHFIKP